MKPESSKLTNGFAKNLIDWYSREKRNLPWREDTSPYSIWLSEIILQQTRVNQGLPYYLAFMETFPTVHDLAKAEESKVLRVWQGLGYYSRARNLHKTAKIVSQEMGGIFPDNYNDLLKLPGIGPYTAAAIASIAFSEVQPALDGNVFRVISRINEIENDISDASSRKVFISALDEIIDNHRPGDFNQALMELGARICIPKNPKCEDCPIESFCASRRKGTQGLFPVKSKKVKVKKRYFHYLHIEFNNLTGMRPRTAKDIWQGLFEFYLVEKESFEVEKMPEVEAAKIEISKPFIHILTHQRIEAKFYRIQFFKEEEFQKMIRNYDLEPYTYEQIVNLPKPKLVVNYLNSF